MPRAHSSSRHLFYNVCLFICLCSGSQQAFAVVSDLLLVLDRDGLSYTLQQTLQTNNELVSVNLPGSVVPLQVQYLDAELPPLDAGASAEPNRVDLTSGTVILRYQHQFGEGLQRDERGQYRLSMRSVPATTTFPTGSVRSQTVTWIFPAGVTIATYSADTDSAQWTQENNVLQFRTTIAESVNIVLNYYWPDSDQDGIPDAVGQVDACNDTPAGYPVDSNGCALDSDQDTVVDGIDQCPSSPPGEPVNAAGCGLDFDSDGVANHADRCRNTPNGVPVDAQGCPADADADGVTDLRDLCIDTPIDVSVNDDGCAPDKDRDAVPDYRDLCPGSTRKTNLLGCNEQDQNVVLSSITFSTGSSFLSVDSRRTLDQVAAAMTFHTAQNFEIGAHTDNQGTRTNNLALSVRRAGSVRRYLMLRGVSANRITAKGYGESNPLLPNTSLEARKKNRRIEIRLR